MERPAKLLRGIQKLWGPSPKFDSVSVNPKDLTIAVARANSDRECIEDSLIQFQKRSQQPRLNSSLKLQQGHARLDRKGAIYQA
jgi:hypothetical protein